MSASTQGATTGLSAFERNRFFYGLLMGVDQFQKDMNYSNGKRWLLNRLVTGSGVVCGLGVSADSTAAAGIVRIQPGVALDGCGHEIVVPAEVVIDARQLTDDQGTATGDPLTTGTVTLCLSYSESCADPVPVLVPDCDNRGNCAASTTREIYRVLVHEAEAGPAAAPTCGFPGLFDSSGASNGNLPDAIQSILDQRVSSACAAANGCACVPLASVDVKSGVVDQTGVRRLVYGNELLLELILCLAEQIAQIAPATSSPQLLRRKKSGPAPGSERRAASKRRKRSGGH
jgi:hypothetical protein